MSNQVQAVKFYDDTLITLEKDGEHYVAVRPIVENMGIDWAKQSTKLKNPKFSCCLMATTGKDGKNYQMLCIPVKKLNGWLFSINPERVRAEIRPIVEQYQEECFAVLHDYWHKGVAVNERADVSVVPAELDITNLPRPTGHLPTKRFVAEVDRYGKMTMREFGDDEFVATFADLPFIIRYQSWNVSPAVLAKIAKTALNQIAGEWE